MYVYTEIYRFVQQQYVFTIHITRFIHSLTKLQIDDMHK